jgi:hypothetical protein
MKLNLECANSLLNKTMDNENIISPALHLKSPLGDFGVKSVLACPD